MRVISNFFLVNLKGGIGNQLFILSKVYKCQLGLTSPKIIINTGSLRLAHSPRSLFAFGIIPLGEGCKLVNSRFISVCLKVISKFISQKDFFFNNRLLTVFDGYFQDEEISDDYVLKLLTLFTNGEHVKVYQDKVLIHTRGGDYFNEVNSKIYFNQTSNQIALLLQNQKSQIDVIGNNEFILKGSYPNANFKSSNEFDDLKSFLSYKTIIASNSTFGLWGTLLAIFNGNVEKLYLPRNYYVDIERNPFKLVFDKYNRQLDIIWY